MYSSVTVLGKSLKTVECDDGRTRIVLPSFESGEYSLLMFDGYFRMSHPSLDHGSDIEEIQLTPEDSSQLSFLTRSGKKFQFSSFDFTKQKKILFQIASGLHFLHKQEFCHSALHTTTLRITPDEEVFFGDFFNLHYCDRDCLDVVNFAGQTTCPDWKGTQSDDIWDLAYVFFSLLYDGNDPIASQSRTRGISRQLAANEMLGITGRIPTLMRLKEVWKGPDEKLVFLQDLLYQMFEPQPFARLTSLQVLCHPFFEDVREDIPGRIYSRAQRRSSKLLPNIREIIKDSYIFIDSNPSSYYLHELYLAADIAFRFGELNEDLSPIFDSVPFDLTNIRDIKLHTHICLIFAIGYFQSSLGSKPYKKRIEELLRNLKKLDYDDGIFHTVFNCYLIKLKGIIYRSYIFDLSREISHYTHLVSFINRKDDNYLKLDLHTIAKEFGGKYLQSTIPKRDSILYAVIKKN